MGDFPWRPTKQYPSISHRILQTSWFVNFIDMSNSQHVPTSQHFFDYITTHHIYDTSYKTCIYIYTYIYTVHICIHYRLYICLNGHTSLSTNIKGKLRPFWGSCRRLRCPKSSTLFGCALHWLINAQRTCAVLQLGQGMSGWLSVRFNLSTRTRWRCITSIYILELSIGYPKISWWWMMDLIHVLKNQQTEEIHPFWWNGPWNLESFLFRVREAFGARWTYVYLEKRVPKPQHLINHDYITIIFRTQMAIHGHLNFSDTTVW